MFNQQALVSVVMPSLNQRAFIAAAVDSVLSQNNVNIELLVADGGSTDGTVEWLTTKQFEDCRLHWFSEPDTGPAEALNKALQRVRGTIIGWLNSDDLYAPGAIERGLDALIARPDWLMVYGHGEHIDVAGKFINRYPTRLPETCIDEFSDGCFICQPTVFFKRSMIILIGSLDESLKTAFDFDYWLRAFVKIPGRIGFVDAVQAYSRLHEDCITLKMRSSVALESMKVLHRHLGAASQHWVSTYINELQARLDSENATRDEINKQQSDFMEAASPFLSQSESMGS